LLASKTISESPVHQVRRLPACDTAFEFDAGPGSSVLDTVVPVWSTTSTLGCGDGRYTAVLFSQTASTRAPEPAAIPGSGTSCCCGSSSSLPGRSSASRRPAWPAQFSSADTPAELAAADTSTQPECSPRADGLTRASVSP
jgi:hypothetical protein